MHDLSYSLPDRRATLFAPHPYVEVPRSAGVVGIKDGNALLASTGNLVRRHHGVWTHASAVVEDRLCESGINLEFQSDRTTIMMAMEEVGGRMELRLQTPLGVRDVHAGQAGAITVLPPGCRVEARSESLRFLRLFTLQLDSNVDCRIPGSGLLKPLVGVSETSLSKICRLLALECKGPEFNGKVYADSLVSALAIAISRYEVGSQSVPKGGLAPWQLRRVQDFMIEHIAKTVTVKELADLAQISLTHFSRAFKASVGCAPHQWMTERRVEIAQKYLLVGAMPIVEISFALGFCDQAHFTRVFRRTIGDTPLMWQRARRM